MCGFCGLIPGAEHWSEVGSGSGAQGGAPAGARHRERLRRAQLLNRITRHYGVEVRDWQGTSWILSYATGETAVIDQLADLWPTVERLSRRTCDPLGDEVIASVARAR